MFWDITNNADAGKHRDDITSKWLDIQLLITKGCGTVAFYLLLDVLMENFFLLSFALKQEIQDDPELSRYTHPEQSCHCWKDTPRGIVCTYWYNQYTAYAPREPYSFTNVELLHC